MTISYNWLNEYLPAKIEPEQLSKILTSIGLEVESMEKFESIKGSLKGLIIGEVVECIQHPNGEKLKLTKVNIGNTEPLQIVCGAPNVAIGQKVIVAKPGTTIYPQKGDPLTIRVAKIRGFESNAMICAEDEIGLGESHSGIIVLPDNVKIGSEAADYYTPYADHIFEIGLTPNHMDAMSHQGVARDVCAYQSHQENKEWKLRLPAVGNLKVDKQGLPLTVTIENKEACQRYSGISITGITIKASPKWMQDRLKAIGMRPINNIVDITNFVLHETGQPLHAFDSDEIKGSQIIIKNLREGTKFITLDEKERKLSGQDMMICNAEEAMCIAGVFGGVKSGVKESTINIFLESAWFRPAEVRKTSLRHGLRTDAAIHFEKGTDISATVTALKRAASLIKEFANGEIASDVVDVYPQPKSKSKVALTHHYLKKLSGKNYSPDTVKNILLSLGFEIIKEGIDDIHVAAPFHKPDIAIPADVVEEIMRIDGYDNINIPTAITISPSVESNTAMASYKEKIADFLMANGFNEIFTNSITNSAYFSPKELERTVKMINNLSTELNVMRPSLLETGLESISYNLNRKMQNLKFFEFGKTYSTKGIGQYGEINHLCLYVTGHIAEDSWKKKAEHADFFFIKGICEKISQLISVNNLSFNSVQNKKLKTGLTGKLHGKAVLETGIVNSSILKLFDIKQEVLFADFNWDILLSQIHKSEIVFQELPKQLPVHRDLAIVVDKSLHYAEVEKAVQRIKLDRLQRMQLFDIFESEKLGADKKSMAVSFTFIDEEKTLTDKEVDEMINKVLVALENDLNAEIRK